MMRKWFTISGVAAAILLAGLAYNAVPIQAQSSTPLITAANVAQVRPLLSSLIPDPWDQSANKVIYSHDGSLMAVGASFPARLTQVFDTHTGKRIAAIDAGAPTAFGADNKTIIGGGYTSTFVWDFTQQTKFTLPGELSVLSSDARFAVIDQGGVGQLIPVGQNSVPLATFPGITDTRYHGGPVALISPDDGYVAWIDQQFTVHVWDVAVKSEQALPPVMTAGITSGLRFSPDSKQLAIIKDDQHILLWNTTKQSEQMVTAATIQTFDVDFSPDSRTLIVYNMRAIYLKSGVKPSPVAISFFDVNTGTSLGTLNRGTDTDAGKFVFSPDGRTALLPFTNSLRAWNLATNTEMSLPANVSKHGFYRVDYSPDGHLLYLGNGSTGITDIWDPTTWTPIASIPGTNYVHLPGGTLLIQVIDDWIVWYGVPDVAHPVSPSLVLPGTAAATIYVRSKPSASASVVRRLETGAVGWAIGQNNGYVYLSNYGGWVRFGDVYFSLDGDIPLDYLPKLDPANVTPFTTTPVSTPAPAGTLTPAMTPTPNKPLPTVTPTANPKVPTQSASGSATRYAPLN